MGIVFNDTGKVAQQVNAHLYGSQRYLPVNVIVQWFCLFTSVLCCGLQPLHSAFQIPGHIFTITECLSKLILYMIFHRSTAFHWRYLQLQCLPDDRIADGFEFCVLLQGNALWKGVRLEQNIGLIYSIAEKIAAKYNCLEFEGNRQYTAYTKNIMDELVGEGILKLGNLIAIGKYGESKGMFTTYIYPHIEGHLRRWMEKNLGCISLSKHMMKQVRQIQKLYHAEGLDTADIAKQHGMPESKVVQRLNYNTHSISLDEMLDNDALPLPDGTSLYGDKYL